MGESFVSRAALFLRSAYPYSLRSVRADLVRRAALAAMSVL